MAHAEEKSIGLVCWLFCLNSRLLETITLNFCRVGISQNLICSSVYTKLSKAEGGPQLMLNIPVFLTDSFLSNSGKP